MELAASWERLTHNSAHPTSTSEKIEAEFWAECGTLLDDSKISEAFAAASTPAASVALKGEKCKEMCWEAVLASCGKRTLPPSAVACGWGELTSAKESGESPSGERESNIWHGNQAFIVCVCVSGV